jgi:hypothetical protein
MQEKKRKIPNALYETYGTQRRPFTLLSLIIVFAMESNIDDREIIERMY